ENIEQVVKQFSQAIITHEKRPGSYAARNQGISLAKGEIIAFTDADCIPTTEWLEKGVANLISNPNCGLVGGKIDLFFVNSERPTPVELYDNIKLGFPQQKFIEESNYAATANLFTWKKTIDAVGLFDDSLKSSGDREWGQRVFSAGYKLVYAEDTCVRHPARYSWSQLRKKIVRVVGGHQDLDKLREKSSIKFFLNSFKDSLQDILPPFRMYFYIWSYESLKDNRQRLQFTMAMIFVRHLRAWERMRLLLGGSSDRG
ncbi:MAG: glycosyltransferase, partial [Coleofasciculaceae cyanobacterium]